MLLEILPFLFSQNVRSTKLLMSLSEGKFRHSTFYIEMTIHVRAHVDFRRSRTGVGLGLASKGEASVYKISQRDLSETEFFSRISL